MYWDGSYFATFENFSSPPPLFFYFVPIKKKRKKEKKKKERRMKILRSAVRGLKYMHIGTYFGNYFKSKI